jgi:hypothetical protein
MQVLRGSTIPGNAAQGWLVPPSIKANLSLSLNFFPCLDLGAPGHLERVDLLCYKTGCFCIGENYKWVKLYKLKIHVPIIKSLVIESNGVWDKGQSPIHSLRHQR